MRIISDFKDYYDIGVSYGIDPKCIYNRKENELFFNSITKDNPTFIQLAMSNPTVEKLLAQTFHATGWSWSSRRSYHYEDYYTRLIFFCGKAYLGVGFRNHYYYDIESLENAIMESGDNAVKEYFYGPPKNQRYYGSEKKQLIRAFEKVEEINNKKGFVDSVLLEADSPIIEFHRFGHDANVSINVNPNLKNLDFTKVMDSFTAFQTISQYITNVLGIKAPPTLEIEDNVRIAKHGFNDKSFRKEKKEK